MICVEFTAAVNTALIGKLKSIADKVNEYLFQFDFVGEDIVIFSDPKYMQCEIYFLLIYTLPVFVKKKRKARQILRSDLFLLRLLGIGRIQFLKCRVCR